MAGRGQGAGKRNGNNKKSSGTGKRGGKAAQPSKGKARDERYADEESGENRSVDRSAPPGGFQDPRRGRRNRGGNNGGNDHGRMSEAGTETTLTDAAAQEQETAEQAAEEHLTSTQSTPAALPLPPPPQATTPIYPPHIHNPNPAAMPPCQNGIAPLSFTTPETGRSNRYDDEGTSPYHYSQAEPADLNEANAREGQARRGTFSTGGSPEELRTMFGDDNDLRPTNLFGAKGPAIDGLPHSAAPAALQPDDEHGKVSEERGSPANGSGATPEVQGFESQGIVPGRTTSCGNPICNVKFNNLKTNLNSCKTDLQHSKDAERNSIRLQKLTDEALRKTRLENEQLKARLNAALDRNKTNKRKISNSGPGPALKKLKDGTSVPVKRRGGVRGVMPLARDTLGELAAKNTQELVAEETVNPHEGYILMVGEMIIRAGVVTTLESTLSGCTECFVEPWNEKWLYSPVMGFFPEKFDMLTWESSTNPDSIVCSLPPEPVTAGLGAPSMSYIRGKKPTVPTAFHLSDSDVGVVSSSLLQSGNREVLGYQMRTVVETLRAYEIDSHSWHAFSPEFDDKGMLKIADDNDEAPRALERLIGRTIRTIFAGDGVDVDELRSKVQKWKDQKVAFDRENAVVPAGISTASDLGLAPGAEITDHDLSVFTHGVSTSILRSKSLRDYIVKSASNAHSNKRSELQKGFIEAIGAFEYDKRLSGTNFEFFTKRDKDARIYRRNFLWGSETDGVDGNDALRAQYENLAKEGVGLNCGHVVRVASAGKKTDKYTSATTYVEWKGDGSGQSNGWRIHTNESCLAFKTGPECSGFGFKPAEESLDNDKLLSEEHWDDNTVLPTENICRDPGPLVDRLFSTVEVRLLMMRYMRRTGEKINVRKTKPDFDDLWAVEESDLQEDEIGVVRRIVGDNTLRWIVIADIDIAVCLHARLCETMYGFRMPTPNHSILYRSLLVPFALNLSRELWDLCTPVPSFTDLEMKIPFDFVVASKWIDARVANRKSGALLPREGESPDSEALLETRAAFDKHVPQTLPSSVHGWSYYMELARNMTYAYWSYTDKVDLLVLTPEFFNCYICSWFGTVRDAHIGFYDPKTPFTGNFHPLYEKYSHEHCWDINASRLDLSGPTGDQRGKEKENEAAPGPMTAQGSHNSTRPIPSDTGSASANAAGPNHLMSRPGPSALPQKKRIPSVFEGEDLPAEAGKSAEEDTGNKNGSESEGDNSEGDADLLSGLRKKKGDETTASPRVSTRSRKNEEDKSLAKDPSTRAQKSPPRKSNRLAQRN